MQLYKYKNYVAKNLNEFSFCKHWSIQNLINSKFFSIHSIHQGHMSTEKPKAHARVCVYWLNMYSDIDYTAKQCIMCNRYANTSYKESMLNHTQFHNNPGKKLVLQS